MATDVFMNPEPNNSESLVWMAIIMTLLFGHPFIAMLLAWIVLECS